MHFNSALTTFDASRMQVAFRESMQSLAQLFDSMRRDKRMSGSDETKCQGCRERKRARERESNNTCSIGRMVSQRG